MMCTCVLGCGDKDEAHYNGRQMKSAGGGK